jgi:predicted enzyme related to lactoylglutathione lyase
MEKAGHFEIPVDDMKRAQAFYSKIFGWSIMAPPGMEGEYHLAMTVASDQTGRPTETGGINGALYKKSGKQDGTVLVIIVDSIDGHMARIEAAGGKMVRGKTPVMEMGFYAQAADTEGNIIGLFETKK